MNWKRASQQQVRRCGAHMNTKWPEVPHLARTISSTAQHLKGQDCTIAQPERWRCRQRSACAVVAA